MVHLMHLLNVIGRPVMSAEQFSPAQVLCFPALPLVSRRSLRPRGRHPASTVGTGMVGGCVRTVSGRPVRSWSFGPAWVMGFLPSVQNDFLNRFPIKIVSAIRAGGVLAAWLLYHLCFPVEVVRCLGCCGSCSLSWLFLLPEPSSSTSGAGRLDDRPGEPSAAPGPGTMSGGDALEGAVPERWYLSGVLVARCPPAVMRNGELRVDRPALSARSRPMTTAVCLTALEHGR